MDIASLANIFLSLNSCGTRLCMGLRRCRRPESEVLQPIDVETVLKQGEFEWISAAVRLSQLVLMTSADDITCAASWNRRYCKKDRTDPSEACNSKGTMLCTRI